MLIKQITNFISAFIASIAVLALIYGGYMYVSAFGEEDKTTKAKKILIGAVIGLILAGAAFAIVNTVIMFEPERAVDLPGAPALE